MKMKKYIFRVELSKPRPGIKLSEIYTVNFSDGVTYSGVTLRQRKYRDIYRLYGYAQSNRADGEKRLIL